MPTPTIQAETLAFLQLLDANNNREWFQAHKDLYEAAQANMVDVAEAIIESLNEIDHLSPTTGKKALMRIYRDIRFSKDKSPYKNYWGGGFQRATVYRRGGYYYHIQPGEQSFVGGGFYGPNKEDLRTIRMAIAEDDRPMRKILADPVFQETFGTLKGEQLKTAPKGFEKDHPAIDLLRYKRFYVSRAFSDEEVLGPDYVTQVVETFAALRPYFDYMSEVLAPKHA